LEIRGFLCFSQVFADENSDKFENVNFSWQLLYYLNNNQKIDFINLNPLFFNNNKNYMLSYYVYVNQANIPQNKRTVQSSTQENNWGLLVLRAIADCLSAVCYGQYNRTIRY